jgi:SOS response regulatory protein OraA/RecX
MSETTLTWRTVDDIAAELGARDWARAKWRQRGVPADWRIKITQALMSRGVPIALSDFDNLPPPKERQEAA